jgi:ferrous iron transport protein B
MPHTKTIAIVGQPNAGKSTLFNVLSDLKTSTSNFAGTSVQMSESLINIYGDYFKIVDLPGTYSLNYSDNAEKVTYDFLLNEKVDLIINVMDASLFVRSLEMTVEIMELGIPMVVALNMMDEAKFSGLEINQDILADELKIPIVPISAIYGKGVKALTTKCYEVLRKNEINFERFPYTQHMEEHVQRITQDIQNRISKSYKVSDVFLAIKAIENPELLPLELQSSLSKALEEVESEIKLEHNVDTYEAISYERHHLSMKIAEKASRFTPKDKLNFIDRLDRFIMNPKYGFLSLPIFFGLMFVTIFYVGNFLTELIEPAFDFIGSLYSPLKEWNMFAWFTVDGIVQGITGAIGIVLPYFLPLVFLTAFFEDTGYLARLAFLIDNTIHRIGLHGKSVAAFILGVGCTVPAIYATRILESRRDRILTGILVPFVPCSARIAVIFALTAAFAGPIWAIVIFLYVILVIAVNGKLISLFLKKPIGLILEIPVLRMPQISMTFRKTWYKIIEFLKEALPFLILGSIFLGWIEYFDIAMYVDLLFAPILEYVLNLPEELGSTLVFGFFRKELILVMANQALGVESLELLPLTTAQVMTFIAFVTFYFPCFTTFVVIWKEFGAKVATGSAVLSIFVAIGSALIFRFLFYVIEYFI